jgi:hypothetical protein
LPYAVVADVQRYRAAAAGERDRSGGGLAVTEQIGGAAARSPLREIAALPEQVVQVPGDAHALLVDGEVGELGTGAALALAGVGITVLLPVTELPDHGDIACTGSARRPCNT